MRNELIPKVLKEYRKRNHYSVKDVSIRLMEHDFDERVKDECGKIDLYDIRYSVTFAFRIKNSGNFIPIT